MSLCLGPRQVSWQGLLWLSIPQASKKKKKGIDRLCHIMRAPPSTPGSDFGSSDPKLMRRESEEPGLTSCQRRMFSTRQTGEWPMTTLDTHSWALAPPSPPHTHPSPLTLWHSWWYLTQCFLPSSLRWIDCATAGIRMPAWGFLPLLLSRSEGCEKFFYEHKKKVLFYFSYNQFHLIIFCL